MRCIGVVLWHTEYDESSVTIGQRSKSTKPPAVDHLPRLFPKHHPTWPLSIWPRRAAEQLRLAAATLVHAIKEGTDLWRRERREECHALYVKAGGRAASQMPPGQALDDLRVALAAAK